MGIFDIFKNKQTDKGLSAIELNNKGTELLGQNRIDDAIICFDKALKINPELIELWINKGVCLIKKRRNNFNTLSKLVYDFFMPFIRLG